MRFLRKLDFLSPKSTLYYKGSAQHKNLPSSILGIILFSLILSLAIYYISNFLSRSNPTAYTFNKNALGIRTANYEKNGIFHYFVKPYLEINPRAVSYIASDQLINNYANGRDYNNYDYWLFEFCDETDYLNVENLIEKKLFFESVCIKKYWSHSDQKLYNFKDKNFKYPSIKYGEDQKELLFYTISIEKCVNDTNDKLNPRNDCLSKTDINKYVENSAYVDMYLVDHSIDVSNYRNAITDYVLEINNAIYNSDSFVINHVNFNPNYLITHDGLLLENSKEEELIVYKQNEKSSFTVNNNIILTSYMFWIKNTATVFERRYKNIIDLCANLGGVTQFIFYAFKLINNIIYHYILFDDTIEILSHYSLDKEGKSTICQKFPSSKKKILSK